MAGILIFFYLAMMPMEVRIDEAIAVPPAGVKEKEAELVVPLPGNGNPDQAGRDLPDARAVAKLPKVVISMDARGQVEAAFGEKKLAAFDAAAKGKMKPLGDWLAKIAARKKVRVEIRISPDAKMEPTTELLNILAENGISEITLVGVKE